MQSNSKNLERIEARLKSINQAKTEYTSTKNTQKMLYQLMNNTGKEDVFLIKAHREFCNFKQKWKRLPVEIDRTLTNVFKNLVYSERRTNISTEERLNSIFKIIKQNVKEIEPTENIINIYNGAGKIIDSVYESEYEDYMGYNETINSQYELYSQLEIQRKVKYNQKKDLDEIYFCKDKYIFSRLKYKHFQRNKTFGVLDFEYKNKKLTLKEQLLEKYVKSKDIIEDLPDYKHEILKLNFLKEKDYNPYDYIRIG